MKPMRWVVLFGVVLAMVFLITFVTNFLPSWGKHPAPKGAVPQARLTFADKITNFPTPDDLNPAVEVGSVALLASPAASGPLLAASAVAGDEDRPHAPQSPPEFEVGTSPAHDFWFKNENDQDLPVGLLDKTCQCTNVYVWIAPKSRTDLPARTDRERAVAELEASGPATDLKEREEGVIVPAGAVGVVRLTWTSDKAQPKSLGATLWMAEKGPGPTQVFEVRTVFVGPLRAAPELSFPDLTPEQLPRTAWIFCWSATRKEFPLYAQPLNSRWKEGTDPCFLGKPEKLSEEELDGLRRDPRNGRVLAGYKTPVILLPHAPLTDADLAELRKDPASSAALADYQAPKDMSGVKTTPFDLGPFRRRIELKTKGGEPIQVAVNGSIRGDLAPQDPAAVPVRFSPFDRTLEPTLPLVLETGPDVTRLELERERTPDYLDVELPQDSELNGGRRLWHVQVKWVVGKGEGVFPRDAEGYRDSAVYIRSVYAKTDGKPAPCLRIPVMGQADAPP